MFLMSVQLVSNRKQIAGFGHPVTITHGLHEPRCVLFVSVLMGIWSASKMTFAIVKHLSRNGATSFGASNTSNLLQN